jgi:hypothetical protein
LDNGESSPPTHSNSSPKTPIPTALLPTTGT